MNKKTPAKKEEGLQQLLIVKLQSLYDTENQLVKALPKMAKKASSVELRKGFENHFKQTKEHVNRLEQAFKLLEIKPKKLAGDAIRGLIADAEWVMKNVKGPDSLDANLIAAAQYVEMYETAGYGSASAWAELIGNNEVAALLEQTLDEEKETNEQLTELATTVINQRAL